MINKNLPGGNCAFVTEATKMANNISLILSENNESIYTRFDLVL